MSTRLLVLAAATVALIVPAGAQVKGFIPVTEEMMRNPSPDDWLMYSRTYDAQRFSPLKSINKSNVSQLRLAWERGLATGTTETIPIVHNGVMYVVAPGAVVQALSAVTGDLLWEYTRKIPANQASQERTKNLAIYDDIVLFTAPDAVVGLDARTGEQRWEAKTTPRGNTSGPLVVEGKVISGGACAGNRDGCFISAHDAKTGKELWKFFTTPAPGEPGDESWGGAELKNRLASTWGLPGSYDPVRKMLYWGVANPMPDQRATRHGKADGTSKTAPADLYSNSTLSIDPTSGKLNWYYQHLPGDDWDSDYTHERVLVHTKISADPKFVKYINPDVKKGEERDVAVTIGEAGGVFVLDRGNGQFLWASPFPFDTPNWVISNIDPKTGRTEINYNNVFKTPGENHVVCYWNTRSYWPTAFSPQTNSLYSSYIDNCRDLTTAVPGGGREAWKVVQRPGGDPAALTGLAKIDLTTGETLRFDIGRAPGNGAMLATAGDLVFHGDMNRRFRAFDAATGKMLWESILGGNISVSTISYAVNGKQYICVMTGDNLKVPELSAEVPEIKTPKHNAIYVFSLP